MILLPAAISILFVASVLAGNTLDLLDDDTRSMINMLHDTCVGESGVDESLISRARKGDFDEDPKFKTYLGCLYQQTGALSDDGEADIDSIIGLLPDPLLDKGTKMFNKCRSAKGSNAADTAFELNKCMYAADPDFYFVF